MMIKNAFAYITRKSLKSIIIMLVILAMSTLSPKMKKNRWKQEHLRNCCL